MPCMEHKSVLTPYYILSLAIFVKFFEGFSEKMFQKFTGITARCDTYVQFWESYVQSSKSGDRSHHIKKPPAPLYASVHASTKRKPGALKSDDDVMHISSKNF
jgi:hypothetical protein